MTRLLELYRNNPRQTWQLLTMLVVFLAIHFILAIAFLYSGPAINIIAIVVTAKVLGAEIGIARAVEAISFSAAAVAGSPARWSPSSRFPRPTNTSRVW